jgi:hypothetical protein
MSIGGFVDAKHKPSMEEIQAALGGKADLWDELVGFISERYDVKGELSFGGSKYGWELSFRKGGRPLADLYPGSGTFTVQVVLGRAATEKATHLRFGPHVNDIFDNARQLYDGRWLFVPIRSKQDIEDIRLLIDAKVQSK